MLQRQDTLFYSVIMGKYQAIFKVNRFMLFTNYLRTYSTILTSSPCDAQLAFGELSIGIFRWGCLGAFL